jgi:hypothetical protein
MFVQDGFLYLIVTKHKLTVSRLNAPGRTKAVIFVLNEMH